MIQLHSHQTGPTYAPRWVVRTDKDLFWNGYDWSPYHEEALLFHDAKEADLVVNDLMKSLFESLQIWNYEATVELEVHGSVKPSLEELKDHLWRTQNLILLFYDDGPETSIVLPIVKWDTLKEIQS